MSRFALVCVDLVHMKARRYVRNSHNKVWVTHECKINSICEGIEWQLDTFRKQPDTFEIWTGAPEAA